MSNSIDISVSTVGVKECLDDVREILSKIELAQAKSEELKESIKFLKVSDVAKLLDMTVPKAREIFHRPDFPCCDYGKEMQVEMSAFKEYFQKAVKKGDF